MFVMDLHLANRIIYNVETAKRNPAMSPKDVLDHFGTQAAIARAVGCKQASVAEWFSTGEVPEGRQYQIELATNGLLRASRPALRTATA